MNRRIGSMLMVFMVLFTAVFSSACPKQTDIRRGADAANEMVGVTRDAISITGQAYQLNIISFTAKNKMADGLGLTLSGIEVFNNAVDELRKQNADGKVSDEKLKNLQAIFADSVVSPFADVLTTTSLLDSNQAKYLKLIVINLRRLIVTVGDVLNVSTIQLENLTALNNTEVNTKWQIV